MCAKDNAIIIAAALFLMRKLDFNWLLLVSRY